MKHTYRMDGKVASTGALDFSWLNDAPAGKHGFLGSKDGHFRFADGTPVKFWGVNVACGATMPDREVAEIMAERIARSGANLVRLHYADVHSSRSLIDYSQGNSRHLNAENLGKLDYFVYQLEKRGVYLHLDLFVARSFLPGDDLDYPDDLDFAPIKQINIFNRRLIELQMEYARNYLTHRNPYTGLRYVEDPGVAVVQIMNENSIFWTLRPERTPSYIKELDQRFNTWLTAKYLSRNALKEAWTNGDGLCGLMENEDPLAGTVLRPRCMEGGQPDMHWQDAWEGIDCPARYADHVEFLLQLQLDYSRRMVDFLHSLGVRCLINVSNHSKGPADNKGITSFEEVTEDNGYWNHPLYDSKTHEAVFHGEIMTDCDPRETLVSPFRQNLLTRIPENRMADKPFMVGEWNNVFPTGYHADAMLMMACYGALQDWDGALLYAYSLTPSLDDMRGEKLDSFWNTYDDPSTYGQLGMAAAIFRCGWVKPARTSVEIGYGEADRRMLDENWMSPFGYLPYVSRVATRLFEQDYEGNADCVLASGMTPAPDYTRAQHAIVYSRSPYADGAHKVKTIDNFIQRHKDVPGIRLIEDGAVMEKDYTQMSRIVDEALKSWQLIGEDQGLTDAEQALRSDTGELLFAYGQKRFEVNTPFVRGFAGQLQGSLDFGLFTLDVKNRYMTVHLIALDGKELAQSRHLLLTAVGECGNTDMVWEDKILRSEGHGPVLVDSLEGVLRTENALRIYPLSPSGEREAACVIEKNQLAFEGETQLYFEIVRE